MPEEEKNKRFTEFIVNDFFTVGLPEAQADHLRELLRTAFAKTDFSLRHSLYRNPERVNGWDVRDLLPKIIAPVLLFYGARDLPLPGRNNLAEELFML